MLAERNLSALRYPRSFLGLLIAGLSPRGAAADRHAAVLGLAYRAPDRAKPQRGARALRRRRARGRSLVNRIGSIERLALQLAVLPDAQLRADFARAHESFRQLSDELARLPLKDEPLAAFARTIEREQALYDYVTRPSRGAPDLRTVRAMAAGLVEDAYQVLAISYFVADREVERLGASADEVHRRLIVMVLIATALALAAALALTRLIARPIAELDSADPPARQRRFHARDPRQRPGRPAKPRRAAGLAAPAPDRAGGAEEPLPAPSFARPEDAAGGIARRHRTAQRPGRRAARTAAAAGGRRSCATTASSCSA